MVIHVGLDMSLRSPGICLIRDGCSDVFVMGFSSRKRDFQFTDICSDTKKNPQKVFVTRYKYPDSSKEWERIPYVVETILKWIEFQIKKNDVSEKVKVYIEGYAFSKTSSMSILCELGGAIKYTMTKKGWPFVALSPSTVKKVFSGNGKASKLQMIAAYADKNMPPFHKILNTLEHQHPHEDMIDAYAVVYTGMLGDKPKPKKTSRKRKQSSVKNAKLSKKHKQ